MRMRPDDHLNAKGYQMFAYTTLMTNRSSVKLFSEMHENDNDIYVSL